jgi:hypothetical protein
MMTAVQKKVNIMSDSLQQTDLFMAEQLMTGKIRAKRIEKLCLANQLAAAFIEACRGKMTETARELLRQTDAVSFFRECYEVRHTLLLAPTDVSASAAWFEQLYRSVAELNSDQLLQEFMTLVVEKSLYEEFNYTSREDREVSLIKRVCVDTFDDALSRHAARLVRHFGIALMTRFITSAMPKCFDTAITENAAFEDDRSLLLAVISEAMKLPKKNITPEFKLRLQILKHLLSTSISLSNFATILQHPCIYNCLESSMISTEAELQLLLKSLQKTTSVRGAVI